jgi:hypothetical protein
MAPEAKKTATFCHRLKPSAKNAKYRTMNANQKTAMMIVPATLDPIEFILPTLAHDTYQQSTIGLCPIPRAEIARKTGLTCLDFNRGTPA